MSVLNLFKIGCYDFLYFTFKLNVNFLNFLSKSGCDIFVNFNLWFDCELFILCMVLFMFLILFFLVYLFKNLVMFLSVKNMYRKFGMYLRNDFINGVFMVGMYVVFYVRNFVYFCCDVFLYVYLVCGRLFLRKMYLF